MVKVQGEGSWGPTKTRMFELNPRCWDHSTTQELLLLADPNPSSSPYSFTLLMSSKGRFFDLFLDDFLFGTFHQRGIIHRATKAPKFKVFPLIWCLEALSSTFLPSTLHALSPPHR